MADAIRQKRAHRCQPVERCGPRLAVRGRAPDRSRGSLGAGPGAAAARGRSAVGAAQRFRRPRAGCRPGERLRVEPARAARASASRSHRRTRLPTQPSRASSPTSAAPRGSAHVARLRLLVIAAAGERLPGEYTFDDRPWRCWLLVHEPDRGGGLLDPDDRVEAVAERQGNELVLHLHGTDRPKWPPLEQPARLR